MKFPEKILVYEDEHGDVKPPLLLAARTPEEAAPEIGCSRRVARYQLVGTVKFTTTVEERKVGR